MTVALCIDDENGRLFCQKRQSRDRVLLEDVKKESEGKLLILPFSQNLLKDGAQLRPDTQEDGFYFLEDQPLAPLKFRITKLILYRWNRLYPADFYLDLSPQDLGLHLVRTEEFCGSSHPVITKEVYER